MWLNLIDDETLRNTEFIYNLSYGKDSMAGLHVTIDILGIPVSRIVHAEVWATDTIPADLPPMVEFKAKADAYIKERWGLTVEHVYATRGGAGDSSKQRSSNCMSEGNTSDNSVDSRCSEGRGAKTGSNGAPSIGEKLTYEKLFYHVPERKKTSKFAGGGTGIPLAQNAMVQRTSQGTSPAIFHTRSGVGARSSNDSAIRGFPIIKGNWCTSDLKRCVF